MSTDEIDLLRVEYSRLKQQETSPEDYFGLEAMVRAREKIKDFCLASGRDFHALDHVFAEEDSYWQLFFSSFNAG